MDVGLLRALLELALVSTLGSAIASVFMWLTLKGTCPFTPAYRDIFVASCVGGLSIVLVIAGFTLLWPGDPSDPILPWYGYGTAFVLDAIILGYRIWHPETGPIGLLKGILLALIHFVTIGIVIFVLFMYGIPIG